MTSLSPKGIISFTLTWGVLGPLALSVTKVQHFKERFSVVGRSRTQKDLLFLTWAWKGHYLASTCSATVTILGVAEVDAELVADPLDDDGGQYDHAGPQTQSFQLLTERTAPVGKGFYRDAGTVGDLLTGHGLHEVKS